ncbi:MAG: TrmH family RNA methyltransferase [Prochloraceae cyanobacterium]
MVGTKSGQVRLNNKAILAEIKRLRVDRAYRDSQGFFYIEGVRNFIRAADNNFKLSTIVFSEKLLTAPIARKLVRQLRRSGVKTINITPEEFRSISQTERASGIGAIAYQHWSKLHDINPNCDLCWVVLETVRSPGNLGTLIRTSEAVGGAGFIFIGKKVDPFDSRAVRPTMGSIFRQKFVRTNFASLTHWIRRHSCRVIGASAEGKTNFHQFKYPRSSLLFLGDERKGLTQQQRDLCQHLVRIPMVGEADSLNLAVAGSLLMYEIYRSKN